MKNSGTGKDWTGNRRSTFAALGAGSHAEQPREEHDFYATDPRAVDALLSTEPVTGSIWECACGAGHLSKRFEELGYKVLSTDLFDHGYGENCRLDFLKSEFLRGDNIITNPPFRYALDFAKRGIQLKPERLCLFLRIQFLEGKERQLFFKEYPPYKVAVHMSRIQCAKDGDFDAMKGKGSAACYAWFIWKPRLQSHEGPRIAWV